MGANLQMAAGSSDETQWRGALRIALSALYASAGLLHLAAPHGFELIVPKALPWPHAIVIGTGFCELAGALGLCIPALRKAAGVALALYAICVFPANIVHAFNNVAVPGLPSSWWYHAPRLALQPVLVWAALYASGALSWPFSRSPRKPVART